MRYLLTAITAITVALTSFGWGQKGHDVTGAIAQAHLTAKADSMVRDLLDGHSMIYYTNWLDNASYTPELRYTKTWHYKNVNKGVRYEEMSPNTAGDAVTAIKSRVEILINPEASRQDKLLAMKILIHGVGDLHQPMHMGHATDLGGNRIKVKFFNRDTKLHTVWDTDLVEAAHKWSYTEWREQLDILTPQQIDSVVYTSSVPSGYHPRIVDDWAKETVAIADTVYDAMPEGTKLMYNEIAWSAPIIEQQLVRAGLRLAYLLNYIADQQ